MTKKENKRKIRAILAGGLVLGVGAMLTMAAWNSSEFATGAFSTGAFVLEGSTAGVEFENHPTGNKAALDFNLDTSKIAADESVSAPFAVRLNEDTTEDANVTLSTHVDGAIDGLSYEVFTTDAFGCDDLTTPFATGLFGGTDVTVPAFSLAHGNNVAGTTQNLCFVVKAGADLEQGSTSEATWQFTAEQM